MKKQQRRSNLLRWQTGRQQTGYEKLLIAKNAFIFPFDCYLLRYKKGAEVPNHKDPVSNKKHYRINIILKNAKKGGQFICKGPIFENSRIKLFRPDISEHAVTKITAGTRYVLSIGWVR